MRASLLLLAVAVVVILFVISLLLLMTGTYAYGEEIEAPSAAQPPARYPHALFVLEASVLAISILEDGRSYSAYEHQSARRFSAINIPIGIAAGLGAWKLEQSKRKPLRVLGHVIMWSAVAHYSVDYFRRPRE